MSDEIKEILDDFKDYELRYKQCNENQFIIFYRDIHLLLNYITNLQTIEREYSSLLSENAKLQQENNFLKEMIRTYYMSEIDRLNNIIKDIKSQLDYLETYSSKEDVFNDMKRRLDRIENILKVNK